MVDMTTMGCHTRLMTSRISPDDQETFAKLKSVRAEAIEHTKLLDGLRSNVREIMLGLIDTGYSQADIARELGVSRQAIQKMLSF